MVIQSTYKTDNASHARPLIAIDKQRRLNKQEQWNQDKIAVK